MIEMGLESWSLFILYLPNAERLDTFPSVSCMIGRLYTISDPWNSGDNYCVTAMHTGGQIVMILSFCDKLFVPWHGFLTVLCGVTMAGLYIKLTFDVGFCCHQDTTSSGSTDS